MKREEIERKVIDIIEDTTGIDMECEEIDNDTNFRGNLGFDSLDEIELIILCEKEFNIAIKDEDIEHIETFGQLLDTAEKLLK